MLLIVITVLGDGNDTADAHTTLHPQKKLFDARWYKPLADLTTSPPWFGVAFDLNNDGVPDPELRCDGGYDNASCVSKWAAPVGAAINDWNSQPSTARFFVQSSRNLFYDVNIYIVDSFGPPGLLGVAFFYDSGGNECDPSFPPYPGYAYCGTYYYGDTVIVDDTHTGVFGTAESKRATIAHELGHLLTLRHESVNADESVLYECGTDDTGAIPVSIMSYDCVNPQGPPYFGNGVFTVQPWDTCGVNHAYPDPIYEWEGCVCYPPPSFPVLPALPPAYYHPVTPTRILDTRPAPFGPIGAPAGRIGHGCHLNVDVTDTYGSTVPASGVSAVVVNVTVTGPSQASHLTIYPSDASLPNAANLNFVTGQTVPNLVTVRVGADGRVKLFNNSGQTHVIFDIVGWYDATPAGAPAAGDAGQTPGTTMAIDADPSGNSSSAVGAIQTCARINENNVIDADEATNVDISNPPDGAPDPDLLVVDVTIKGIPAFNPASDTGGIIDYLYDVYYPQAQLTVERKITTDPAVNKLFANPGSEQLVPDPSDPLPDDNVGGFWTSEQFDLADTAVSPAESGDGVLDRLTITTEQSAASGEYAVSLGNQTYRDAASTAFEPIVSAFSSIAVNQPCGYGYYHPVTPNRILDTRPPPFGPIGAAGQIGPGGTIDVQVAGVPGSNVPANGVTAVVFNATVTGPTAPSHLTIYPAGASLPNAANLNFVAGQTVPNLVTVKVGTGGRVTVFNNSGFTYVIFDIVGWYGGASGGSLFNSLPPKRILDTRPAPFGPIPVGGFTGPIGPGGEIVVDVTDTGGSGVPATGVAAVIVNTTVTQPTAPSHLTVCPSDVAVAPNAANLNFVAGQTVPNLVIVKVGPAFGGSVKIRNNSGYVHVIMDVAGYFQ